ncbi:MAG: DUF58 domain-containing protein [Lentisphaeraceae bacterium]|nr:DUF58 domain-containing protein [Lentisphaeraceae bacterium]
MSNVTHSNSHLYKYIDAETLMQMKAYDLRAKIVVQSFLQGLHRSPYHGISSQFSEYKVYVEGDDLRHLDWKLFARSDRYYIRKYEGETNMQCHILLDLSRSMDFSHVGWSKAEYASTLAATLAYFLYGQRDAFGLLTFDNEMIEFLPARLKKGHFNHFLAALEHKSTSKDSGITKALKESLKAIKKRGLQIIISDMLMDLDDLEEQLSYIRAQGQEILLFQVLDPVELDLNVDEASLFEDLETGKKIFVNPELVKKEYQEKINAHNDKLKTICESHGIAYQLMLTDQPLNEALAELLRVRGKGKF